MGQAQSHQKVYKLGQLEETEEEKNKDNPQNEKRKIAHKRCRLAETKDLFNADRYLEQAFYYKITVMPLHVWKRMATLMALV